MTTQTDHGAQPDQNNEGNAGETPQDPMDMSQYSAEQLLDALTAAPKPQDAPPSSKPEPAETESTQGDLDEGKGKDKGIRVRLTALPQEQQVETLEALKLIQSGEAGDMLEALQKIRGVSTTTATPAASAPEQDNPTSNAAESAKNNDTIAELEATLKELRVKRKEAKTELFDADLEEELTEQIEDTQRKIAIETARQELRSEQEKSRAEQEQALVADYQKQYLAAVSELETTYPDVLDDDSEFTQLLTEKMDAAKLRKDPNLSDPRFILTKAAEVSALLNRSSGRPPTPPPAKPLAKGSSVATPHNASPRPTKDQVLLAIETASEGELFQALFKET